MVKEAGEATNDMRSLIVMPIIPILFGLCYMVWFIAVSLYIMSVGTYSSAPTPDVIRYRVTDVFKTNPLFPANYSSFTWDQNLKNAFALNFFHMLWNVQFLIYFTYLVAAGAVADWYFTPRNENGHKQRADGRVSTATCYIYNLILFCFVFVFFFF